jgi:ABC-type sulfate transport system, periplasmic component
VLLAWENEAFLSIEELGPDKFDIVVPSLSILAEPPVALVDRNVDRHGTREVAQAYLDYLYAPAGQKLAARHYYRPRHPEHADPADIARFPKVQLVTIESAFGSWAQAHQRHFTDGGQFDQILARK